MSEPITPVVPEEKIHEFSITAHQMAGGQMAADIKIVGNLEQLAQALLAFMRQDTRVLHIVTQAVANGIIGNNVDAKRVETPKSEILT